MNRTLDAIGLRHHQDVVVKESRRASRGNLSRYVT
jgi:hypothetical protein